ncbi:hypothetical protein PAEPH01_0793 [Pancytospora epiphaga]|nr:hypothetical protein PAEPH01_0793 [Pancytospora epiphaga]
MAMFLILWAFGLVFGEALLTIKTKVVKVKLLVNEDYIMMSGMTPEAFYIYLETIAAATASSFDASKRANDKGYRILFTLDKVFDNPVIKDDTPTTCESGIGSISNLLNEVNLSDPRNHYIVFMPCPAETYAEAFESADVSIPLVKYELNLECSRRVGIFSEVNQTDIMSSFSNALIYILGAKINDKTTISQTSGGDNGVMNTINLNEQTVSDILHNKCFINS